jgi:hypothetical protein
MVGMTSEQAPQPESISHDQAAAILSRLNEVMANIDALNNRVRELEAWREGTPPDTPGA